MILGLVCWVITFKMQTKNCSFVILAGSHLHADPDKNMGSLAPIYPHPPSTAVVCRDADNGDASAVATMFEPYPSS